MMLEKRNKSEESGGCSGDEKPAGSPLMKDATRALNWSARSTPPVKPPGISSGWRSLN